MSNSRRILLVYLVTFTTLAFSQTIESTQSPENLLQIRLELARGYLKEAGLHVPAEFDVEHLPELRAELRAWLDRQTTVPGPAVEAAVEASSGGSEDEDRERLLTGLHVTKPERFIRLWKYRAEAQEQPKTIVVGSNKTQELNPDHVLWKHSVLLKFSELSFSSADLASIYGSYAKVADKNTLDPAKNADCPIKAELIPCLRRIRRLDFFWRGVSGFTATVSMGQNPRFQQSGLLASGQAQRLYSGQVDFDPTSLFPNGSDWANVAKSLGAFRLPDDLKTEMSKSCRKWIQLALILSCFQNGSGPTNCFPQ